MNRVEKASGQEDDGIGRRHPFAVEAAKAGGEVPGSYQRVLGPGGQGGDGVTRIFKIDENGRAQDAAAARIKEDLDLFSSELLSERVQGAIGGLEDGDPGVDIAIAAVAAIGENPGPPFFIRDQQIEGMSSPGKGSEKAVLRHAKLVPFAFKSNQLRRSRKALRAVFVRESSSSIDEE